VCSLLKFFAMEIFTYHFAALKRFFFFTPPAHPDALRNIASAACTSAHSPGGTSARRAGVGATGISYARSGTRHRQIFIDQAGTSMCPSECFRASLTLRRRSARQC